MTVIKILPNPSDPLGGIKGQIFQFPTQSVVKIFSEIAHAVRGTINLKLIKCGFRSKACVPHLGGGAGLILAQNDDGPLNGPMAHIPFKYMQISKF